jgi:hypothetical protein
MRIKKKKNWKKKEKHLNIKKFTKNLFYNNDFKIKRIKNKIRDNI